MTRNEKVRERMKAKAKECADHLRDIGRACGLSETQACGLTDAVLTEVWGDAVKVRETLKAEASEFANRLREIGRAYGLSATEASGLTAAVLTEESSDAADLARIAAQIGGVVDADRKDPEQEEKTVIRPDEQEGE